MKTLKAIPYQQGTLFVDEQAEIKEGDYFFANQDVRKCVHVKQNTDYEELYPYGEDNEKGERIYHFKTWKTKIIAQHNLKNIPYVELEEDVEKWALEVADKDMRLTPHNHAPYRLGLVNGYKAAQQKKYTEDDLLELSCKMYNHYFLTKGEEDTFRTKAIEFIQSLQPKIESIEIETKEIEYGHVDDYSKHMDLNKNQSPTKNKVRLI